VVGDCVVWERVLFAEETLRRSRRLALFRLLAFWSEWGRVSDLWGLRGICVAGVLQWRRGIWGMSMMLCEGGW